MKRKILSIFALIVMVASASMVFAWGVWGHEHANHGAVFALPEGMRKFFYNHIDFITQEATVPDLRKYTLGDKVEGQRHYIDLEDYGFTNLDSAPRTLKDAAAKYNEKTLQEQGILPWYIQEMTSKLTDAFKSKRRNEILFLAGDLGHYLADANMPLHTSNNHDGQLTKQKGIHSFWESQLPEYFGSNYHLNVKDAVYLKDVTAASWDIIKHSHSLADSLLTIERNVMASFPENKLYKKDSSGNIAKNIFGRTVFSDDFAAAYHKALGGMVESQLQHAIQDIANFWYTAWVNAGKPDLNQLDSPEVTAANSKKYESELKLYNKGKLSGFKPEKEYR
jgi:hypothetical protein